MKREYDFSKGVLGKFFRHRVKLNLPVYLDEEVFLFVQDIASKRKADASTVVNGSSLFRVGRISGSGLPASRACRATTGIGKPLRWAPRPLSRAPFEPHDAVSYWHEAGYGVSGADGIKRTQPRMQASSAGPTPSKPVPSKGKGSSSSRSSSEATHTK